MKGEKKIEETGVVVNQEEVEEEKVTQDELDELFGPSLGKETKEMPNPFDSILDQEEEEEKEEEEETSEEVEDNESREDNEEQEEVAETEEESDEKGESEEEVGEDQGDGDEEGAEDSSEEVEEEGSEVDSLKAQNEKLLEIINAGAIVETPEKDEKTEEIEQKKDLVIESTMKSLDFTDEQFEEIISSKTKFAKTLTEFASVVRQQAMQDSANYIARYNQVERDIDSFFKTEKNKDLLQVRDYIERQADIIADTHPTKSVKQILELTGEAAREKFGDILNGTVKVEKTRSKVKKVEKRKPKFAKASGQKKQAKKQEKMSDIEEQLAELHRVGGGSDGFTI